MPSNKMFFLKNQVEDLIKSCGIQLTFKGYNDKRKTFRRVKCFVESVTINQLALVTSKVHEFFGEENVINVVHGQECKNDHYQNFGESIQVYFKL